MDLFKQSDRKQPDLKARLKQRVVPGPTLTLILGLGSALALLMSSTSAQAQQREIINPSFEDGPTPGRFVIHSDTLQPGWFSTDGTMETWRDGFLERDAFDGDFFVELNPRRPVGLYQEICLVNGESLSWDFEHAARGRSGDQVINYEVVSLDGATIHQLLTTNTVTGMASASSDNSNNLWDNVAGSTIYNGPTGIQRLQFRSTNAGSSGNFLDNILIDLVPSVGFAGIDTADFENVNPTVPVLLITGVVTSPLTITVDATSASTATEGVDYDFVTKTLTVPAGTYDGTSAASQFSIPLVVYEDGDHTEADETIIIELISALADDPTFNPVSVNSDCTPIAATPTITHTILNTLLIEAAAESFPEINGTLGGTTTSVLAGDMLGGAPVDPADITLTVGASDPELTLDPATGLITVAPGTPAGTYMVEYTICENDNPTNCATVTETVTVTLPTADLSVTKTNTPGANAEVDQSADTLTSGATTTYVVTVTNNGPDAVDGAVVTDVVGSGLTCAGSDPVTISGDGIPAGSFTIADLTGAGITLGNLEDTEAAVLTYSCTVD